MAVPKKKAAVKKPVAKVKEPVTVSYEEEAPEVEDERLNTVYKIKTKLSNSEIEIYEADFR